MPSLKTIQIRVDGLPELFKTLKGIDAKVSRKLKRKALAEIGKYVQKEMKAAAPKDTGWLKKSIAHKVVIRSRQAYVVIGPQSLTTRTRAGKKKVSTIKLTAFGKRIQKAKVANNPAKYAHFTEFGTKRGVKAQRWFRNTVDKVQPRLLRIAHEVFAAGITEAGIR